MNAEIILEARNVIKSFPGVRALDQVNLCIQKGEIHALVGENGAGKSSLMHVLCGVVHPDAGTLLLRTAPVTFANPNQAIQAGIGMVFQELSLVNGISVAENIFANRQPVVHGDFIDWFSLNKKTQNLFDLFGIALDPNRLVSKLTKSEQQVVEILKAISMDPDVLILDEPTSSLTALETIKLFDYIKRFKNLGRSCIYISHNLDEVFTIADRVTVLRDGKCVATKRIGDTSPDDLIRLMAGVELVNMYGVGKLRSKETEPFFRVEGLTVEPHFRNVSFNLHKGEIVGLAGLVGSGRTALGRTLFGCHKMQRGGFRIDGHSLFLNSPSAAIRHGIAYVSDDRKKDGLFLQKSVMDNLVANKLERFADHFGMLHNQCIAQNAADYIHQNNIVCRNADQKISTLSGGNQQKVLLTAWLTLNPTVLIVDEPTRGVDVRSKSQIYQVLHDLARRGTGILLISSDIREILGVCDRVLVFRRGMVTADYPASAVTGETILAAAAGLGEGSCRIH